MSEFVNVAEEKNLPDGKMLLVKVAGHDILLARAGSKYYAIDNRCPHAGGNLSAGTLEGTVVTCPRHGSQWELTDGHCVRWTRNPAATPKVAKTVTYSVRVEQGKVMVGV